MLQIGPGAGLAKAGTHSSMSSGVAGWIPAFAGIYFSSGDPATGGRNFARYALFAPNSAASASRTVSRSRLWASISGAVSTMMSSMSRVSFRRL
jgi:hypothetical protein